MKYGEKAESELLIVKYLTKFPNNEKYSARTLKMKSSFEGESIPKFCIILSNKFAKKSSVKNKIKRAISVGIEQSIKNEFHGWFVFIPKRRILGQDDKITVDVEKISAEAYSTLSKVAFV